MACRKSMSQPVSSAKRKKKSNLFVIVLLILCLFGAAAIGYSMFSSFQKNLKEQLEAVKRDTITVEEGDIKVEVIESGPLHARNSVEVKSRVSGRVQQLLVDEGDVVEKGELVAIIDPQETELQVRQNQAQLRGAQAGVQRISVEMSQREITAKTNLARAQSRLRQIELELKEQPKLTSASISSAESALASAKQALDLLTRITQPNTKVQVESALQEAKANLQNAEIESDRRKSLLEKGYISRREFEQAELNLSLARTRVVTAQERVDKLGREQELERKQAEERIKSATQDLNRARSTGSLDRVKLEERARAQQDVRDAQAALKDVQALAASRAQQNATVDQLQSVLGDAQRQLGETEIRAPVTGIVTKRFVQLGELVASLSGFSAGTPVFMLEDRSAMKVRLSINEIDVAKLTMGMEATITVDAFKDKRFKGRVSKISPASEMAAQAAAADPVVKYTVEVTLDATSPELKSGMSAQCSMLVMNRPKVLRVQRDYVVREEDGSYHVLLVKDPKSKDKKTGKPVTEKVKVKVGESSGAYVEIKSGVKKGDMLFKPEFTGPGRKTFFADGDEAERAKQKDAEEKGESPEGEEGNEGSQVKVTVS